MADYDHIRADERGIIITIILRALRQGLKISVWDEEEQALTKTDNFADIVANVAQTDLTTLRFWDGGTKLGSAMFVHGNGRDVLSDYSAVPAINALMDDLCGLEFVPDPKLVMRTSGNAYTLAVPETGKWAGQDVLMVAAIKLDDTIDHTTWTEFNSVNVANARFGVHLIRTLQALRSQEYPRREH